MYRVVLLNINNVVPKNIANVQTNQIHESDITIKYTFMNLSL